jgi:hypothetical protein
LPLSGAGRVLSEVGAQIERTSINIRAAAEAMVTGQKGDFERLSGALASAIGTARTEISALLDDDSDDEIRDEPAVLVPLPVPPPKMALGATFPDIQMRATNCVQRHTLKNNAKRLALEPHLRCKTFEGSNPSMAH